MSATRPTLSVSMTDAARAVDAFRADVVAGLGRRPAALPCKYLYDRVGARLFERICGLDAYYPTRTEIAILHRHVGDMAAALGPHCTVVEPGSGSGLKTRLLLSALDRPLAYVPIDLAAEQLQAGAAALRREFPRLAVTPLLADFTAGIALPELLTPTARRVVYFPGSTIGNFERGEAEVFLIHLRRIAGVDGRLLIGIDLDKHPALLERAYDDELGVTAAFNRNLLGRINRELGGDCALSRWRHEARYRADEHRIEMRLISIGSQELRIGGNRFDFADGEAIRTEYSHKYSIPDFAELAAAAGWTIQRHWCDERGWFAVLLFGSD